MQLGVHSLVASEKDKFHFRLRLSAESEPQPSTAAFQSHQLLDSSSLNAMLKVALYFAGSHSLQDTMYHERLSFPGVDLDNIFVRRNFLQCANGREIPRVFTTENTLFSLQATKFRTMKLVF